MHVLTGLVITLLALIRHASDANNETCDQASPKWLALGAAYYSLRMPCVLSTPPKRVLINPLNNQTVKQKVAL
jgi:hypothetical protein